MLHLGRTIAGSAGIAALAACVTVGGAQGATITDTAPVLYYSPDSGVDIFVPQFDAALGTLTGVSASLTGQFTPRVSFDQAPPPSMSPVQFNPEVTLVDVSDPAFNVLDIRSRQSLATEYTPILSNQTTIGTPDAVNNTAALPLTGSPVSYAGSGDLDFYITGSSGVSPSYGRYVVNDQNTLTGQFAVTYSYTPSAAVPEPTSLALLGAGLLGLCTVRSRGRKPSSS